MKAGFLSLARELSSNSVSFTVLIRGEHTKGGPERFLVLGVGLRVHTKLLEDWATESLSPFRLSKFSCGPRAPPGGKKEDIEVDYSLSPLNKE